MPNQNGFIECWKEGKVSTTQAIEHLLETLSVAHEKMDWEVSNRVIQQHLRDAIELVEILRDEHEHLEQAAQRELPLE